MSFIIVTRGDLKRLDRPFRRNIQGCKKIVPAGDSNDIRDVDATKAVIEAAPEDLETQESACSHACDVDPREFMLAKHNYHAGVTPATRKKSNR